MTLLKRQTIQNAKILYVRRKEKLARDKISIWLSSAECCSNVGLIDIRSPILSSARNSRRTLYSRISSPRSRSSLLGSRYGAPIEVWILKSRTQCESTARVMTNRFCTADWLCLRCVYFYCQRCMWFTRAKTAKSSYKIIGWDSV